MSSPKGWPTSKKSDSSIPGFTSDQTKTVAEFSTVQNTGSDRIALDTTQRVAFSVSIGNLIEAGTTKRIIKCTGINARKGDLIKFTSGALSAIDAPVLSAPDADTIILGTELDAVPVVGVTFELCRYTFFKVDSTGQIVATSGPLQIKVDGIDTYITIDSTDVANKPMPSGIMIRDGLGKWIPVPVTATNEIKTHDTDLLTELQRANAKLVDGDVDTLVGLDAVVGVVLYTGVAKKIRLAQNGGASLLIYKNAVKIGALEAGGSFTFDVDMIVTDDLIVKTKTGTANTTLSWNALA